MSNIDTLTPRRQNEIDKALNAVLFSFNDKIICNCKSTAEATYAINVLTHHVTDMLFKVIHANMALAEAKAVFKIALDSAIGEYGLSVMIHEFS